MEKKDTCSICFDAFTHPKMLECGHTFCFQCLKDYIKERSVGLDLLCPLCRAKWKIPKEGLHHLPTNYFVDILQLQTKDKYCYSCQKMGEIFNLCNICGSYLCAQCYGKHFHSQKDEKVTDHHNGSQDFGVPFFNGMKTQYEFMAKNHFVVEIPENDRDNHTIYDIKISKFGGLFVVPCGVPYILKYNSTGELLDKIRTPFQCVGIEESGENSLLATFVYDRVILKYEHGYWGNFTACEDFYPADVLELSDGTVLACGSNKIQSSRDPFVDQTGYLQLYSPQGEPLLRLDKFITNSAPLVFPHKLAYIRTNQCIAVADQGTNSVIILKEDGSSYKIFKSSYAVTLSAPFVGEHSINLNIAGMCSDENGYFIVSSSQGVLCFFDCFGKISGLAWTNGEDRFGRQFPHVARDKNGIIWCSDSLYGTVKSFKIVRYKNNLNVDRNGISNLFDINASIF